MTGRRGRGRGRNATSTRNIVRAAQKRDAGKKLVPAMRPPQIVRLPWNAYCYSATYSTASSTQITVSIGSIRGQIIARMGLTGAPGQISIKVNTAYAWNVATGGSFAQPSLEGLFWELCTDSGGSYSVRSEQYDHGTLNVPARVGYLYPLSDRKEIHTSDNDSHVVAKFVVPSSTGGNGVITVRVNVLWNCAATPTQLNIHDALADNPVDLDRLDINPEKESSSSQDE